MKYFPYLCTKYKLNMERSDINTKEQTTQEEPEYPWYEGQGRGMYDDDREEAGDETDTYDNIAGVLRY